MGRQKQQKNDKCNHFRPRVNQFPTSFNMFLLLTPHYTSIYIGLFFVDQFENKLKLYSIQSKIKKSKQEMNMCLCVMCIYSTASYYKKKTTTTTKKSGFRHRPQPNIKSCHFPWTIYNLRSVSGLLHGNDFFFIFLFRTVRLMIVNSDLAFGFGIDSSQCSHRFASPFPSVCGQI